MKLDDANRSRHTAHLSQIWIDAASALQFVVSIQGDRKGSLHVNWQTSRFGVWVESESVDYSHDSIAADLSTGCETGADYFTARRSNLEITVVPSEWISLTQEIFRVAPKATVSC